jgi:hypothetical protein
MIRKVELTIATTYTLYVDDAGSTPLELGFRLYRIAENDPALGDLVPMISELEDDIQDLDVFGVDDQAVVSLDDILAALAAGKLATSK